MKNPKLVTEKLRRAVQEILYTIYSYMKHDVLPNLAERFKPKLTAFLGDDGTPKTRASHAEANLLTLPAQLRNRIYQLVLIANYGTKRPDETYAIEIASPDTGDGF